MSGAARDGDVAIVVLDNPPVNALSFAVRSAIADGLARARSDASLRAVVLIGAGDGGFSGGADIREFGGPARMPGLRELIDELEGMPKPVVAALHGNTLGGGFELALGCHFRVALASARLGLPEVNLGLLPGAGGTQRLPRLIGAAAALDVMLSGKPISGAEALKLGAVDELAPGTTREELLRAAVSFARRCAEEKRPLRLARERDDAIARTEPGLFAELRRKNEKKWKGLLAPQSIVDCVEAACSKPFAEAYRFEAEAFRELMRSPQSAAQRHLFFAEREAARIPGLPKDATPAEIRRVGIVGSGTMGGGIAMCFANAGIPVQILEANAEALARGRGVIEKNYSISVERGSLARAAADRALSLITGSTDGAALRDCDLVIEAVFESMELKREVFARLDAIVRPGAILASNTSSLDIDRIAAATKRPADVIGMHFFSPANVMKLLENVRGKASSPRAIATAMAVGKRIGKVAVLAGNCDGFIGNRILAVYGRECDFLLEEGATPWQIDRALQALGFPMGLYLMRDMSGLDVGWGVRKHREATRDKSLRYSPLGDRICELGRFGQKTGAGYYKYEGRTPTPDPETLRLAESVARELGIRRREIQDDEITQRVLCSIVNEGARIVEEGIALRASDIDVVYVNGYGFPRALGGPMFWAERRGLAAVARQVEKYHAEHGVFWTPAPLLLRAASAGKGWSGAA